MNGSELNHDVHKKQMRWMIVAREAEIVVCEALQMVDVLDSSELQHAAYVLDNSMYAY